MKIMPTFEVRTEIDIATRPEKVWNILADTARWGEWNSYLMRLTGDIAVGSTIHANVHMADGSESEFDSDIDVVRVNERLSWKGGDDAGDVRANHIFEIESRYGACVFVHRETFTGNKAEEAYLANRKNLSESFVLMNKALKTQSEL